MHNSVRVPVMSSSNSASRTAVPLGAVECADSAVSASTYAVPPGFLWLVDVCLLSATWIIAWALSPTTQWLAAAEHLGRVPGFTGLALPSAADGTGLRPFAEVAWIPLVMVPMALLSMQMLGGYRPLLEQSRVKMILSSVIAPLFGLSLVTLALVTVRNQGTSRALIFSFTLMSAATLLASRYSIRLYKYRRLLAGHYARNIIVVAPAAARAALAERFGTVSSHFHRWYGHLDVPSPEAELAPTAAQGSGALPALGGVDDLGRLLIHRPIHEVLVVQCPGSERWLPQVLEHCEYFQVTVRFVPDVLLAQGWTATSLIGQGPLNVPEIVIRPHRLNERALFVKRMFDIVVSAVMLTLLAPIFALVAIAIKLTTPGLPVFYPWRVIGYKGRPFTGYKFTTMVADADQRKGELLHLNEMSGPVFKIGNDPRITPLGRILRKFSLNELPQLWSVLTGDMSLVGPRPAYPNELARYELWHKRKLCVQPGMTCLWQVRGRNKISNFDDWVRMDFEYIDNWSLWLDCRILIRTFWAVVGGTGS